MTSQITKVLYITAAWTFISFFKFLIGWGQLTEMEYDFTRRDPMIAFEASILTGILAGTIGGSVLVVFWEKWLRSKPYGWTLRNILITYLVIFVLIAILTGLFHHVNYTGLSVWHPQVWYLAVDNLTHISTLVPMVFWLMVVVGTMIVFLVNDKYGPGVFQRMLLGKYFNPSREERVFMFLDLRASTTIAETLGEQQYFEFLKEVYKSVTPGILKFDGEIYQYVGDEIVVSWPFESGIHKANCINCFFEIRQILASRRDHFQSQYNVVPEFKAGLHYGHVMAGEIGVVKRDIAFLGDVLNTTSRIQGKCNELGVDILLSGYLVQKLRGAIKGLNPKELGEIDLRGKRKKVALFTV